MLGCTLGRKGHGGDSRVRTGNVVLECLTRSYQAAVGRTSGRPGEKSMRRGCGQGCAQTLGSKEPSELKPAAQEIAVIAM